jgi:hypothetical protein
MDNKEKQKIKPIYAELQGYLSQAPSISDKSRIFNDMTLAQQVNSSIKELNEVFEENYDKFSIEEKTIEWNGRYRKVIEIKSYRTKLGGLIARLHGKYFSDEPAPFSGMPNTVINQTQNQSQSVQIQILLETQSIIDNALHNVEKGSDEENFLNKIKDSLSSVKSVTELISLILSSAKEFGLSVVEILKILF